MKYLLFFVIFFKSLVFAIDYPNKPIEFVVGLGEGGSADRMARAMANYLQEELDVYISVKNIKKDASLEAVNYLLKRPSDGYTIFSSTFSPYLANAILSGNGSFILRDFEFINLQWFEYDFFVVNKESRFNSILEVIEFIKINPKNLSVGVINKSSGHILFKLLLEKLNMPFENVNLKLFEGGKKARESLLENKVDILIIAAQGSESYRDEIKPLAISSQKRSKRWDAPTLNEAIADLGIELPVINGPIRGIAVSKKFKEDYPHRFKIFKNALKKTLAKRKVQSLLKRENIGYSWIGSRNSNAILQESFESFKRFQYLIKD